MKRLINRLLLSMYEYDSIFVSICKSRLNERFLFRILFGPGWRNNRFDFDMIKFQEKVDMVEGCYSSTIVSGNDIF